MNYKYKLERLEKSAKIEKTGNLQELLIHDKEWAEAEPDNFLAWQGIGNALRRLGRPKEAIPMYLKGLELAPPRPIDFFGGNLSVATVWYGLGCAYVELGDPTKAIDALTAAARIDPGQVEILNNLGVAYCLANKGKDAFEAFKSAAAAAPTNVIVLANLGKLYARGGVEQGVTTVHGIIGKTDTRAANAFLADAKEILGGGSSPTSAFTVFK